MNDESDRERFIREREAEEKKWDAVYFLAAVALMLLVWGIIFLFSC